MGIEVEFWNSSRDFSGQRGDTSLSYPLWVVTAVFAEELFSSGFHGRVFGYAVLIWADTGEIRSKAAQGYL
jgi:hypothetical protein